MCNASPGFSLRPTHKVSPTYGKIFHLLARDLMLIVFIQPFYFSLRLYQCFVGKRSVGRHVRAPPERARTSPGLQRQNSFTPRTFTKKIPKFCRSCRPDQHHTPMAFQYQNSVSTYLHFSLEEQHNLPLFLVLGWTIKSRYSGRKY